MRRSIVALAVAQLAALVMHGAPYAQDFPTRPIRIITSLPGGGSDFTARLIAQGITAPLGQPVIVENRPSNLTGEFAMKGLPDGYTLLVEGNSFWYGPLIQPQRYDVLRDFTPVSIALNSPNVIVAHPSLPVTSIKELIAMAKAKPGQLNYGSSFGSTSHLGIAMLNTMAGINIMHVFYKGAGPAAVAVVAGEVHLMSGSAASVAALTKSGKVRALAITSAKPSALLPGLPTVGSTVPGYALELTTGLFASGKPSKSVIGRLNQEIVRALNVKEINEKFMNAGGETVGSTPEEFTASIKSDMVRMGKVIKEAGIKAE